MILISEAAKRLGVTRQTISNWGERGLIEIKPIGRAYYVSEEIIDKLGTFTNELERAKQELQQEEDLVRKEWYDLRQRREMQRYLKLIDKYSIENGFYKTVIDLLLVFCINLREAHILKAIMIEGANWNDVAEELGLTRERVRQIAFKAIRKAGDLSNVREWYDNYQSLVAERDSLLTRVEELKQLKEIPQDDAEIEEDFEELKTLVEIFSIPIEDCDLTVKAMLTLKRNDCKTIGDIVKLSKKDILATRNCGKKTLGEIQDFIGRVDLDFSTDVEAIQRKYAKIIEKQKNYGKEETH